MLHDKADAISTKQFAILVFIAGLAGKLFTLPAAFVKSGGRSAWLALAICFAVDLLTLGLFLLAAKRCPDKTIFELVEGKLGKIAAKVIFFVALLYLMCKTLSFVLMVSDFGARELFKGIPPVLTLLPLVILMCVMGLRGFQPIGRTAEIMIYFVAVAMLCLILLVQKSTDITKMMPPFGEGSITAPLMRFPFLACGDFVALYFTMGKLKRDKGFSWAASGAGLVSLAAVALFTILSFAALMNLRTITPDTVVSVITRTSTSRLGFGRIDKIAFAVCMLAPVLTGGMFFRAAVVSAKYITGVMCPIKRSVALSIAIFAVAFFAGEAGFLDFVTRYGIFFAPALLIGIPLLLWVLSLCKTREASA